MQEEAGTGLERGGLQEDVRCVGCEAGVSVEPDVEAVELVMVDVAAEGEGGVILGGGIVGPAVRTRVV